MKASRAPVFEGEERRRTRIVFPSGAEAHIWKVITSLIVGWTLWTTHSIEELKSKLVAGNITCFAAKTNEGSSR